LVDLLKNLQRHHLQLSLLHLLPLHHRSNQLLHLNHCRIKLERLEFVLRPVDVNVLLFDGALLK
jgi:hypothetical protein